MPKAPRKRLYLVDAMSQIYRAYYAIRGLATSTGIPTNASYGFAMMLRKLITDEKPDFLGVCFDTPDRTFRHEAYESYKATRSGMPDDLNTQLPYIDRLCNALRVPTLRMPGFEADDVIGTLAHLAEEAGLDVVIVTNDKDMCQLVNDHVKLLRTDRNGNMIWVDAKAVEAKMGVRPDQVVDLLGLWGDTSDNIPGAPGVGEKGAQQIIQQFGTLGNALSHADELSRKTYRESLKNNVETILRSRELATIKCDLAVTLDLGALVYEEPDRSAAYDLFSELEFTTLKREFADAAGASKQAKEALTSRSAQSVLNYTRASTREELSQLIVSAWAADRLALSCAERDGELSGLAISTGASAASLIDFAGFEAGIDPLSMLNETFENGLVPKVIHDWKGLLTALNRFASRRQVAGATAAQAGETRSTNDGAICDFQPAFHIEGVEDDTLIAAYLLDPNRTTYRLPDMAREHLGIEVPELETENNLNGARALQTADLTFQLAEVLRQKIRLNELEKVYSEIELPLVEILFDMECAGVRIDMRALAEAGHDFEKELGRLTGEIYKLAGEEFNINSPSKLGEVFERLKFEVGRKTKTGKISTSIDVLEELATRYELPKLVIEYRELAKLKSTYIDALPKLIDPRTGRVHTTLNQTVSATGRLSSTNPNLQNIPIRSEMGRRIRAAFVASPGYLMMSADYSQIELRLFAHITGDPAMTDAFNRGEDIHARTAREVFGATTKQQEAEARRVAKIVNFAIPYVIGPFGLAQRTGLTRAQAKKAIENYYQTYTGVRRYMTELPQQVRKTGIVRTVFGRIRPIPDINNKNGMLRARAEREAINAPLQGTAADLVKMAMIRVHGRLKREGSSARMVLQVHDELLLEVPDNEVERVKEVVRTEMESVYDLSVPLVVDIGVGRNWMEAKP
jgi:DNA polymerase I